MNKKILLGILAGVLAVGISIPTCKYLYNKSWDWYEYRTMKRNEIKREVFENGTPYINGMVSELANLKLQYDRTDDEKEKEAIANYILERYATFDEENIEDDNLKSFLLDLRGGLR